MRKKPKVGYDNTGFKPGAKPVVLPKKPKRTEEQRLQDVLKENQRIISPKGKTAAEAAARKAIEKKYPRMFIPPGTRNSAGVKRGYGD
jgi:hypothetical protein